MYSVRILCLVAVVASVATADIETCKKALNPIVMKCCNNDLSMKYLTLSDAEECFKLPDDPISCAQEICIAKKKGFITADDKLDVVKLQENLEKDFSSEPDFIEAYKKKCKNADLGIFGPPDACDLVKMRRCLEMQAIKLCPDWSDENDCKGTKEIMQECTKMIP